MGILSALFPKKTDQRFGELHYAFGKWTSRNAKIFGEAGVPLRIPGDRSGPSAAALRTLQSTEAAYDNLKPEIARSLYELYENIAQSADHAQLSEELGRPFPKLASSADVWNHVKLTRVWISAYGKPGDIELAWFPEWEIEHTAGALIRDGKLVEFCASVGPW